MTVDDEAPTSAPLTDEDIVDEIKSQQEATEAADEEDEDEPPSNPKDLVLSQAHSLQAMKDAVSYLQTGLMKRTNTSQLLDLLAPLEKSLASMQHKEMKQPTMMDFFTQ